MRVLSIDPGVLNLGVIILDVVDSKHTIIYMENINLIGKAKVKCVCIIDQLKSLSSHLQRIEAQYQPIDNILIEYQMKRNMTSCAIYNATIYHVINSPIHICHPSQKKKQYGSDTIGYSNNKKASTELFCRFLQSQNIPTPARKIADVADAYCQCVEWLEREKKILPV
jgi:Holliday junction resolvasome RuvABC endonuclease subunit